MDTQKIAVYVDKNQDRNHLEITEALAEKFSVTVIKQEVDYISDNIAIEFKTPSDFYASIRDGRIWSQAKSLSEFRTRLFLVSGNFYRDLLIAPVRKEYLYNKIWGCISTLHISFSVPTVILDEKDAVHLMVSYFERLGKGKESMRPVYVRKSLPLKERQENALCEITGVSIKKASLLLSAFSNLQNIAVAERNDYGKVRGIGEKLSKEIYDFFRIRYPDRREENGKK